MRSLITGCSGLIGPHLAEHLLRCGDQVGGTYHSSAESLRHLCKRLDLFHCDITIAAEVQRTVQASPSDRIFHLAAQSLPMKSWDDPGPTLQSNLLGTLNLLEAVRRHQPHSLIVVLGSSAEYGGLPAPDQRIPESSPLQPDSPYGVSKVAAELLADAYGRAYGMKIVRVRPFFIVGPGRAQNVFSDLAKQIVSAENGLVRELHFRKQSTVRDIVDVRDAVQAIAVIAERGVAGEVYNLCGGNGCRIAEALEFMARLATKPVPQCAGGNNPRPLDTPVLVGDNSRLRQLGWIPRIPLEQTLRDVLDFWRAEFRQSSAHSLSS